MDPLVYWIALALVKTLQGLPLRTVARIGRYGGALAYWLDARHRNVALNNLTMCFEKEKSRAEIRAIARENLRRIGENYCCAIKTAGIISNYRLITALIRIRKMKTLSRPTQPAILVLFRRRMRSGPTTKQIIFCESAHRVTSRA